MNRYDDIVPMDTDELAKVAYAWAEQNYNAQNTRYDVIVECMTLEEIEASLIDGDVTTAEDACKWADELAGLQHEQELNKAWDGPESVRSSSQYNPRYDASGEWIGA